MARYPRKVQVPGEADMPTAQPEQADKAVESPVKAGSYAHLHSHEIDAKTLKKSVLCKDGWVCPDLPPQPAQRA